MLLLSAGCMMQTYDEAKKAPEVSSECSPSVQLHLDRDHGVVPLPVHLRAETECTLETPVWDFGDGTLVEGNDLDHLYLGSGAFTVTVRVGELVETHVVDVSPPVCPDLEDLRQVGQLASDELDEASGLSHSPTGVLWTHNDSGDAPRLFAMGTDGSDLGTYALEDAPSGDWEDSARGVDPNTGEVTLFVGDIGDNSANRDTIVVFMVPEPDVSVGEHVLDTWTRMDLRYPDGPRNADTLMVDPVTGDVLIVAGDGGVYRKPAPHLPDEMADMEFVAQLDLEDPTGGDISPLGDRIAVRSGDEARMWLRDGSASFEEALEGSGCALELADEVRGEALAFSANGQSYFTVSEELGQPIWEVGFVPLEQPCADLEARIVRSSDGELPLEVELSVDEACVPAGIASVEWQLGGLELQGQGASTTLFASGDYDLQVTLTDQDGGSVTSHDVVRVLPQSCPEVQPEQELGTVTDDRIVEASGLAHTGDGLLWTHNDSGGVGELFALSESGAVVDHIDLDISSGDWEDLAYGETERGMTLFVGDVGDNAVKRDDITIYLVPEDDPQDLGEMTLRYADGPHNCESIAIDPVTQDLVIITKDYGGDTSVWTKPAPHADGQDVELTWIADLDTDELPGHAATTAADFHPDGHLLAVRTYSHVWLFRRDQAEPLAHAFEREPCDGEAPSEQQGEAVSFSQDGDGYFLLSEGQDQPLWFVSVD